jgi:hypothetical protein
MNEVLRTYPSCLYGPEDATSLANAARKQLQNQIIVDNDVPSWADSAKLLEHFFVRVSQSKLRSVGGELTADEVAR